jgi:hypothetical protein
MAATTDHAAQRRADEREATLPIKQPSLPVATHHLLRILVQEVELVRFASL